jgi:PleD family two-component response regulator
MIRVTGSVGLAEVAPGASIERAMSNADIALYRAKDMGRNRCHVDMPKAA